MPDKSIAQKPLSSVSAPLSNLFPKTEKKEAKAPREEVKTNAVVLATPPALEPLPKPQIVRTAIKKKPTKEPQPILTATPKRQASKGAKRLPRAQLPRAKPKVKVLAHMRTKGMKESIVFRIYPYEKRVKQVIFRSKDGRKARTYFDKLKANHKGKVGAIMLISRIHQGPHKRPKDTILAQTRK